MASFKKFLAYTAVTAAAVAGGVALYKKVQENKSNCNDSDDYNDFDDSDFDDDFDMDDMEVENRSYTSLSPETTDENNNSSDEPTDEAK